MQLLNKVNKYSSAVDVTANMVIGGPLRNYFMSVFNVYVNEATEYVKQHPYYRDSGAGANEEFENLPTDKFVEEEEGQHLNEDSGVPSQEELSDSDPKPKMLYCLVNVLIFLPSLTHGILIGNCNFSQPIEKGTIDLSDSDVLGW